MYRRPTPLRKNSWGEKLYPRFFWGEGGVCTQANTLRARYSRFNKIALLASFIFLPNSHVNTIYLEQFHEHMAYSRKAFVFLK